MNNDLISRKWLTDAIRNRRTYLSYEDAKDVIDLINNAPTVDIKDQIAGAYNEGYACGSRENERPQGERAERALAIIDRLRTYGHINNREQGTLRRAIILPEKTQGEWICITKLTFPQYQQDEYKCSQCNKLCRVAYYFCPFCGAKMNKEKNNGK